MYYKITSNNNIFLTNKLNYIRELSNGTVIRCNQSNANGITLNGINYYVDGYPTFSTVNYNTAVIEEITRLEYLTLADELNIAIEYNLDDIPILMESRQQQEAKIDYLSMMTDIDLDGGI